MAHMIFLRAFPASLQTVFLETFILVPASSKESPSRSTSLKASISAASRITGGKPEGGKGSNLLIGGIKPILTGFGGLPIGPCLLLWHSRRIRRAIIYVIYPKIYIRFCQPHHFSETAIAFDGHRRTHSMQPEHFFGLTTTGCSSRNSRTLKTQLFTHSPQRKHAS